MRLLRGEFHDGDTIVADARGGELEFRRVDERVAVAAGA